MANPENRLTRELDTRAATQRPTSWKPPETLPSPNPRPGVAHRWIRTALMGNFDPTNASAKLREGWEPCKAEDYPELMVLADNNPNSRFKGNIEIGGLMLCRIPEEFMKQRAQHFENINKSQLESVDNSFLRQNDPRMPLFSEKRSTVSFGKGK
jgi:hypothetical protein